MQLNREARWILEEKYQRIQTPEFFADLKRLEAGEPVDYIIGFVEFAGCRIGLLRHPLIPRPETEYWTQEVIKELRSVFSANEEIRCLDLFSGSGCVGIALLKHLPNATVDFADIDEGCLTQIEENLIQNTIDTTRARIFASDVFSSIPAQRYHLITANPPYINPAHSAGRVAKSVKNFEPHRALFAGEEGYEYIRRVLAETENFLLPGGRLYLEHDDIQKEKITELLHEYGYSKFSFHKDQFGKWRWVSLMN